MSYVPSRRRNKLTETYRISLLCTPCKRTDTVLITYSPDHQERPEVVGCKGCGRTREITLGRCAVYRDDDIQVYVDQPTINQIAGFETRRAINAQMADIHTPGIST